MKRKVIKIIGCVSAVSFCLMGCGKSTTPAAPTLYVYVETGVNGTLCSNAGYIRVMNIRALAGIATRAYPGAYPHAIDITPTLATVSAIYDQANPGMAVDSSAIAPYGKGKAKEWNILVGSGCGACGDGGPGRLGTKLFPAMIADELRSFPSAAVTHPISRASIPVDRKRLTETVMAHEIAHNISGIGGGHPVHPSFSYPGSGFGASTHHLMEEHPGITWMHCVPIPYFHPTEEAHVPVAFP